jgi:hypothetical protein
MEYGLVTMPSHPPERTLYDGHQCDLVQRRWADELGFCFDYSETPGAWRHSMELLAREVMPRFAGLVPK